jgi:S-DNA-T family DNA segregation ATPase FtsK/SpoIIIE
MATLAACEDVVIWAIDQKKGMELGPWAGCIDRLATTPEEAAALLADAVKILAWVTMVAAVVIRLARSTPGPPSGTVHAPVTCPTWTNCLAP